MAATDRQLARIVRSTSDGIAALDFDGRITCWNPAMERMYGYRASEAVGRPASLIIAPERATLFPTYLRRALAGQSVPSYENVHVRRDGTRVDVSITLSALRDERDRVIGASAIIRDITEAIHEREKLRNAAHNLGQLNTHREEFLALLAHEIRLPVSGITLLAEGLVRSSGLNDRERSAMAQLRDQALALSVLAEDALTVGRLESTDPQICLRTDDVRTAIWTAIDRVTDERIRPTLPCGEVIANVDREKLTQAIVNLLTNALKYSPPSTPVEVSLTDDERDHLRIDVRDHGIGLEPHEARVVFDKYVRASNAAAQDPGGIGLGLYMVRLIAQAHRGSVSVMSMGRGTGSTFTLSLPRMSP